MPPVQLFTTFPPGGTFLNTTTARSAAQVISHTIISFIATVPLSSTSFGRFLYNSCPDSKIRLIFSTQAASPPNAPHPHMRLVPVTGIRANMCARGAFVAMLSLFPPALSFGTTPKPTQSSRLQYPLEALAKTFPEAPLSAHRRIDFTAMCAVKKGQRFESKKIGTIFPRRP